MIFYKSVASGNDFLHVDTREFQSYVKSIEALAGFTPGKGSLVKQMCRRHTGAGADGVVFYTLNEKSTGPHTIDRNNTTNTIHSQDTAANPSVKFEIFNQDGNEAELSGNGMGGLAALMFYRGLFVDDVTLDTRVGQRTHRLLQRHANRFRINIEIGPPDFEATHFFPFLEKGKLEYGFKGVTFYPVSVGNPHVVVILDKHMEDIELEELGRQLEGAAIFPHKTNVEFVLAADFGPVYYETGENVRLFFYERGVGRTLASSTGSSAVFAVLQKLGKLTDTLLIDNIKNSFENKSETPQDDVYSALHTGLRGDEKIKISGKNTIFIENSVEIVYKGVLDI